MSQELQRHQLERVRLSQGRVDGSNPVGIGRPKGPMCIAKRHVKELTDVEYKDRRKTPAHILGVRSLL